MKFSKSIIVAVLLFATAAINSSAIVVPLHDETRKDVNLGQVKVPNPHMVLTDEPEAVCMVNTAVSVTLDATHYASYSVTLTSPTGDSVTVNATTPTVTIPVTAGDAYVITVDGGDYGTYDGVFSRTGSSTVTLSDRQALRLAQNRRTVNSGVNFYSATVPAVINDSLRCPVATPPAQAWANDSTVQKWLMFIDEHPDWGWAHECTYVYLPKTVSTGDSITLLSYAGQMPPRNVSFSPVELNVTYGLSDFHVLPQSVVSSLSAPMMSPGAGQHDTKVIIIGCFTDNGSGIVSPGQRNPTAGGCVRSHAAAGLAG